MRTWAKVSLVGVAIVVTGFLALAGTSGYFVLKHLDTRTATEAEAGREFDTIRGSFRGRQPLIEVDGKTGEFHINRIAQPDGRPVTTFHVLTWNPEDNEVFRTEAPIWLMRFSMLNVLSQLGIAPERFRLTLQDIKRYGPGIVIDYTPPGQKRAILWVD